MTGEREDDLDEDGGSPFAGKAGSDSWMPLPAGERLTFSHQECPNCGHVDPTANFNDRPGPVQAEIERLREARKLIPHPDEVPQWGGDDWRLAARRFREATP